MTGIADIKIKTECVMYRVVFFPFATYTRVGKVVLVKVLGVPVYKAVGDCRWLLGFTYVAA